MSKGFHHQDINLSFSNDYQDQAHQQQQQSHIAQRSRRDKLRVPGFGLPGIAGEEEPGGMPVYETGAMWSDMFNYQTGGASTSAEYLDNQINTAGNYRMQQTEAGVAAPPVGVANDWYGDRQGVVGGMGPLGNSKQQQPNSDNRDSIAVAQNHQISSLNADSAAAMQLFLMNPQPRSPSPTPPQSHSHTHTSSSAPLHLLIPNQSSSHHPNLQAFHSHSVTGVFGSSSTPIPPSQFNWASTSSDNGASQLNKLGPGLENQGLSLTLSTSLQHLEAAKAEEFRMGEDGVFYYDQGSGSSSTTPAFHLRNNHHSHNQGLHLQGVSHGHTQNHHIVGLRSQIGVVSLLRNSKYVKAAQELLEEFCSVGRGHMKNKRSSLGRQNSNINTNQSSGGNDSSSSSKDLPPLSAADRIDYQRKKTKLLTMLDEVDRRYNHYCEQMQLVVHSFDSVMGFGSAMPYTVLAQKAMSRHFRCLKDAITAQLKQTCEQLGDKDSAGGTGVTKGETPRLKLLEQSLRQQRAFHQMGMMEQEAWRPQRGLPERSVNILRAWLFEHFLHPYPSDADKHLLARQTGLSRNQVSNWFINARVRLWKPMVEEMYQQEAKDEEEGDEDERGSNNTAQTPMPCSTTTTTTSITTTTAQPVSIAVTIPTTAATTTAGKRSQLNDIDNDLTVNTQCFSETQPFHIPPTTTTATSHHDMASFATHFGVDDPPCIIGTDYRTTSASADMASTLVRYGTTMGDVSLTLGLRHAGNLPEKDHFSIRDFGGC